MKRRKYDRLFEEDIIGEMRIADPKILGAAAKRWAGLVRKQNEKEKKMAEQLRKFGPKMAEHPSIGEKCPACDVAFMAGDFTTLVALGPGDDKEAQKKAIQGRPYNAVSVEVHYTCATGDLEWDYVNDSGRGKNKD